MSDELKSYVLQSYEPRSYKPQPYGTDEPTTDPVEDQNGGDAGCCSSPPDPDPGPPKG